MVVDLAHARARHVRLHHHGEQRLVDPPAALQQRREERASPQLRDRQLQVPRRGRQGPGPVPVALHGPGIPALTPLGTDQGRDLRLDELLEHHLDRGADHVHPIGGIQRVEQVKQGRLGQGHRVFSFVKFLGRYSRSLTRWPLKPQETGPELHHSTGRDPIRLLGELTLRPGSVGGPAEVRFPLRQRSHGFARQVSPPDPRLVARVASGPATFADGLTTFSAGQVSPVDRLSRLDSHEERPRHSH